MYSSLICTLLNQIEALVEEATNPEGFSGGESKCGSYPQLELHSLWRFCLRCQRLAVHHSGDALLCGHRYFVPCRGEMLHTVGHFLFLYVEEKLSYGLNCLPIFWARESEVIEMNNTPLNVEKRLHQGVYSCLFLQKLHTTSVYRVVSFLHLQ